MIIKRYSLGLSSFPLICNEIMTAAEIYEYNRDWNKVKSILIEENRIQRTRHSTRRVASNETIKRLKHLRDWELDSLNHSRDSGNNKFICLVLAARQYPLLQDLVSEFLIYKKEGKDPELHRNELINWFEMLGNSHPEIMEMKPGSFRRLISNTLLILIEGGLLEDTNGEFQITVPGVSSTLLSEYEEKGSADDLRLLLKTETEIKKILEAR